MAHFDLPLSELRSFKPNIAEPADFDEFWALTLAEAREAGDDVEIADAGANLAHVDVLDVTFPGYGGDPIKAWFVRPSQASGPLPCVVQYAGYGGGRGLAIEHTFWASAGFAALIMDTRGQGSAWGNGGDTPDPHGAGPALPGFMTKGILDPKDYYYRRVYTDAVRAVDCARAMPGVDPDKIIVAGGSQGGGITIAAAALVPDVIAAMPDVAFLCHFERAISVTDDDPYGEIKRYLSVHRDHTETAMNTLSYFDGVNLAKRAKAPSLWSVGLMDTVCPPSTTYAAINWYGANAQAAGVTVVKDVEVYPFNSHEGGGGHQAFRQIQFIRNTLNP